jgi:hypothetical protein
LAAIDGNPGTAWQTALGAPDQAGQWVQYTLDAPLTVSRLDLQVVADGRHSVPTRITVSADGQAESVDLPAVADRKAPGSVVAVPVDLPAPVTGATIRVTVDSVRSETTTDYDTQAQDTLPIGIAELGIPGLTAPPTPANLSGTCSDDLLTIDGNPVWVSVSGTTATALARDPLSVALCGPDVAGIHLVAGSHTLRSVNGATSGIDLDALALASAAGGGAATVSPSGQLAPPAKVPTPSVTLGRQTSTTIHLELSGVTTSTQPFELVLGQSINAGWQATTAGHAFGRPVLIDGFANSWRIDPVLLESDIQDGRLAVTLNWAPQRSVNLALVISAATVVLCLGILLVVVLRRRRSGVEGYDGENDDVDAYTDRTDNELTWVEGDKSVPAPWGMTVAGAVVVGIAAWLIAAPITGLVVGVATGVVLRRPRWRLVLGVVATVAIAAVGIYVVVSQGVDPKPANGGWPAAFGVAGALAWVGVLFLVADGAVEVIFGSRRRRGESDDVEVDESMGVAPDSEPGAAQVPELKI